MSLTELIRLFKRRIVIVIALPLVLGVGTAVVCWGFMPDQYASEVSLYLTATGDTSNGDKASDADKKTTDDVLLLAGSERILDQTAESLQLATLVGYKITVNSVDSSRMITVRVVGKDPQSVALVADAMAMEIVKTVSDVMNLNGVHIANEAKIPQAPLGPNRVLYTALALLAGLVLAVVVVLLMHVFNPSVRSKKEAEDLLGVPVVGRLPYVKDLE